MIEDAILPAAGKSRSAALIAAQNRVLELAVADAPLPQTLDAIVTIVEELSTSGVLASILLLDEDGCHLRHGAAPSLPAEYNALIDGIEVGPAVGSCGSAVHRNEPVFVTDIATDPLWTDYKEIALGYGLQSCWSIPIRSVQGRVFGTFVMYHREPREPLGTDLEIVDFVVRTAGLVIERAQTEAARRDSEERLRIATSHAEIGFWDVDEIAGKLIWPPIVKAMFGISADVPVSMDDFYAGLHPEDAPATAEAYAAAADPARRAVYDVEYRTIGKEDGVIRWVGAKGRGVFDSEGKCIRVTGSAIDITRRKAMELQLRQLNANLEQRVTAASAERQIFASAIETSPAPTLICDMDYRVVAVNAAATIAFERVYGVRPDVGSNLLKILDVLPQHRERVAAIWARALGGEQITEISSFQQRDGSPLHLEMRFTHLVDREGRQVGAVQTAYNVTKRVQAERELEETQSALLQSQKMEATGQLTGGVAHDFNNLLTPIIGSLDMLQRKGFGTEREQRLIAGAAQSAERAKTLVQRLLAFARRQPLQPIPVDIARLITGMGDLISSTTGPQIKVIVDAPGELPPAHADPSQLEMALLNLAVNARDAMPDGGTLRISARAEIVARGGDDGLSAGGYVRLSVADTGVGMDEDTLARAVEPFFSTKGIGRGTGLGLSMVHGLASQLGGALVIQSKPGLGTNMELWIPQSLAAPVVEPPPQPVVQRVENRPVVMLVDDEPLVRMTTADMLDDLGYEVIEAENAEEAMRLVSGGASFDILVTDHLMPGMTGIELAAQFREILPSARALLVSGYADFEGISADLPRLVKPFRKDDLALSLAYLMATTDLLPS